MPATFLPDCTYRLGDGGSRSVAFPSVVQLLTAIENNERGSTPVSLPTEQIPDIDPLPLQEAISALLRNDASNEL